MTATDSGPHLQSTFGRPLVLAALAGMLALGPVAAQVGIDESQELAFDRPESWAMQYFSSVSLLTGMGVPRDLKPGAIDLGLEGGWVPSLDDAERTVGFFGTKMEDLNKTSVYGRPRVVFGLPKRFSLTLSYVPPVEAFGIEPNLLAVGVGHTLWSHGNKRLGASLAGQTGKLKGDFLCSAEEAAAGSDRTLNPFGCEEASRDELDLQTVSLELGGAITVGRFEPYLAASYTWMDLEFLVNARYSGLVDRTRLYTDGNTVSAMAGTGVATSPRSRVAIELYYTPLEVQRGLRAPTRTEDLFNVRVLFSYKIREGRNSSS